MCLGLAARIISRDTDHPDLAVADIAGVQSTVNLGLLEDPVEPGDWVLVHMGFALSAIAPEELDGVLASIGMMAEQREAESPLRYLDEEPEWIR